MRKLWFILFAHCLFVHGVQAQIIDSRKEIKHQFAVKAGMNYSSVAFKPSVSQELKPGLILGAAYNYQAQHAAGVLIEFLYVQSGWKETFSDQAMYYSRDLTYLEMPFLANFVVGKKRLHFKFQLGSRISYLINQTENTNIDTPPPNRVYYGQTIPDEFELGVAAGTGVSYNFPFGDLQFDFRFNIGLSNLFDYTPDFTLQGSKPQSLALSLYYWFDAK